MIYIIKNGFHVQIIHQMPEENNKMNSILYFPLIKAISFQTLLNEGTLTTKTK